MGEGREGVIISKLRLKHAYAPKGAADNTDKTSPKADKEVVGGGSELSFELSLNYH